MLSLQDICACLSIERISRCSCVTASMDHLVFDSTRDVNDGDAMVVEAKVVRCYNSSAEIIVRVLLDPSLSPFLCEDDEPFCVAHAFFVFVRLDRGKMPQAFPQTAAEIQGFELSMERRKARQSSRRVASVPREGTAPTAEDAPSIPCDRSSLEFTHIVLPSHANHMGNLFGGEILQWAEEIAVLSATKHMKVAQKENYPIHFFGGNLSEPQLGLVDPATTSYDSSLPRAHIRQFLLSTVYMHGMSFVRPSTVGDRIVLRAQCCRAFGSVVEVEVVVTATDVTGNSHRHINTGYFVICCWGSEQLREILVPAVEAVTVEENRRFDESLCRMIVASVRSAASATLETPMVLQEYSMASSIVRLSQMLAMQETSIWNSRLPSSLEFSPVFELECASEFTLQDISGLLCALSTDHGDDAGDGAWNTMPPISNCTHGSMYRKMCTNGVTRIKLDVSIGATIKDVEELVLDLGKRSTWDNILTGRVIKNVSEHVSLVWMGSNVGVDYSLLRCHRELEDGRIAIVSRSIVHPDIRPPAGAETKYRRAEVLPSGFLLSETGSELSSRVETRVQYLLQLDELSTEHFSGKNDHPLLSLKFTMSVSDEIQGKQTQSIMRALGNLKSVLEGKTSHADKA